MHSVQFAHAPSVTAVAAEGFQPILARAWAGHDEPGKFDQGVQTFVINAMFIACGLGRQFRADPQEPVQKFEEDFVPVHNVAGRAEAFWG